MTNPYQPPLTRSVPPSSRREQPLRHAHVFRYPEWFRPFTIAFLIVTWGITGILLIAPARNVIQLFSVARPGTSLVNIYLVALVLLMVHCVLILIVLPLLLLRMERQFRIAIAPDHLDLKGAFYRSATVHYQDIVRAQWSWTPWPVLKLSTDRIRWKIELISTGRQHRRQLLALLRDHIDVRVQQGWDERQAGKFARRFSNHESGSPRGELLNSSN